MEILQLIIISILPVYIVLLYVYNKDIHKEPSNLLKKLFFKGILICIPAAFIEFSLEPLFGDVENMNLIHLFIYVLIDIALVEELTKWFVVYKNTYHHIEFDEIYDAIVYAVFVSLGFACFENIFYVLESGFGVGIFRAITAIPGHASDAIIMGNYLGLAKLNDVNKNNKLRNRYLLLSIIMPTIAHAIYDYCLYTGRIIFVIIFIIFIIFIYIYSIKKIKNVSLNNKQIVNNKLLYNNRIKFCNKCGSLVFGNYCHRCGNNLNK